MQAPFAVITTLVFTLVVAPGGVRAWAGICADGVRCRTQQEQASLDVPVTQATERPPPKVVVNREKHDFGTLSVGLTGSQDFVLTNAGGQPLVCKRGRSTCGCCTCVCKVHLPAPDTIAPGKSAKVTLEWTSTLYTGPFRQSVTVLTNDPARREVKLLVTGRFSATVRAVPQELVFSRVPFGQSATGEVRILSYLNEPLKVLGAALADPRGADHFKVTCAALAADQLRAETGARTGYLVRVTVGPSLVPGSFHRCVRIKTNLNSVPCVEIPVLGIVGSDVSIVGRGWNAQTGVLTLGTVNSRAPARWPLEIVIRGPHAKDVKFESVQTVPEFLEVKLGETALLGSGALSRTRLTVEVPPGSPVASHLDSDQEELGLVKLLTSHPAIPEVRIPVRFAVAR